MLVYACIGMNHPGPTIKKLRELEGWTQPEFAKKLGMDQPTVSRIERGARAVPADEQQKIAKLFKKTLDEFEDLWKPKITRTVGGAGIPVVNRAPAGVVLDYNEYGVDSGQGFEYLDWGDIHDDLAFALIVVGDSMEPSIHEGDYLIFSSLNMPKPRVDLKPGMVVFVRFNAESSRQGCTVARWQPQEGGMVVLAKDNPKYQPILCRRDEIEQLAVFIEKRTKRV